MTRPSDEQLALLLQVSRDFAFEQMSEGMRLVPFSACVRPNGDIDFVRIAGDDTERPLDEVYEELQDVLAKGAAQDELLAASLVVGVGLDPAQDGYTQAVRVHVEAPGISRQVLAPFAIEPARAGEEKGSLSLGDLRPYDTEAVIFNTQ